jgi:hypothetical protein
MQAGRLVTASNFYARESLETPLSRADACYSGVLQHQTLIGVYNHQGVCTTPPLAPRLYHGTKECSTKQVGAGGEEAYPPDGARCTSSPDLLRLTNQGKPSQVALCGVDVPISSAYSELDTSNTPPGTPCKKCLNFSKGTDQMSSGTLLFIEGHTAK